MAELGTANIGGRAVPAWVLESTAEEIDNMKWFSKPNLLDNWYFGNPVDQRLGYVVPPGVAYKDANAGTTVGTTTAYYKVTQFSGGNAIIQIGGTNYFVQPGGYVLGYTGTGYTIDRWCTDIDNGGVVLAGSNGITLTSQGMYWGERLSNIADLSGKTMTASVLMSDGSLFCGTVVIAWALNAPQSFFDNSLINVYANKIGDNLAQFEIASNAVNVSILAAKLEFGPTQTLAHQENGQWVLNEVPEYGEQLRRCQRYFWRFSPPQYVAGAIAFGIDANTARAIIYLPEQMRTSPTLNLDACAGLFLTGASGDIFGMTTSGVWIGPNVVCIDFKKNGAFEANAPYFVRGDTNAYIDISAGL